MADRKNLRRERGSPRLGTRLLAFTDDEAIELLRAAVRDAGNQLAFAKRHRIDRSTLNQMLNGKKPLTSAVLDAVGLRKVYARQISMKMRRRKPSEIPGYWIRRLQTVGAQAHNVFDDNDALVLLKAAIERAGSQAAFAHNHGIDRSYISLMITGRSPVAQSVIKALGLRRVYIKEGSPSSQ